MAYFDDRMALLGITTQDNIIELLKYEPTLQQNILSPEPIFRPHPKGIEIIVYTIDRSTIRISKDGSKQKKNWSIIRLENPIHKPDGNVIKYLMPKGQGSYPFFPPSLIQKFENKTPIQTLVLTEGFFKAFKGAMHGIDIVGLPSITHLKDKETGAIHPDILSIIHTCNVKRVIWLTDGDSLDISKDAGDSKKATDLYKRPASFFASINSFKQLFDDYDVDKYWFYIDSDGIVANEAASGNATITRNDVKGLDDVMVALPNTISDIVADLQMVSKPGIYFQKFNITHGLSKVREAFKINNVNSFYLYHVERHPEIKNKPFIFHGTQYQYNEEKGECDVLVPGDSKKYFRVGDTYYKWVFVPNKYGQKERQFKMRQKGTICDDHGKEFIKHIPKFEAFCNVPDHVNFQQVIDNCFNVYNPLDFLPEEEICTAEDCPTILNYIGHLFGHNIIHYTHPKSKQKLEVSVFEMALDYVQLLYQRPWEKLPILCLVSKENNTGKSTFGKLLKLIFGANAAVVGNADLAGDFNAHWSTKLVVVCDETKIDKQAVIEKVKSLSTADKIMMNAKGKDHVEIDCFLKFIFITNNEENFINIYEEDIRYWIIKVPVLKEENPTILDNMLEEIPAFLNFLNHRKLATEKLNRMWFYPPLLRTEALKKVIQYSKPTIEKELVQKLQDIFFDFGVDTIYMAKNDIHKEFFNNRFESNYLEKILRENLKVDQYHILDNNELDMFGNPKKIYKVTRYSYPKWEQKHIDGKMEPVRVEVNCIGRPFVFKREDFINSDKQVVIDPHDGFINQLTNPVPEPQLPF